ncbi:MAG: SMP-30/gluconolactonase/LRE family protein [Silvibacterium sp.]
MSVRVVEQLPRTTLGEGPLWDGGKLHYVDIVAGEIHRHDFATQAHDVISTGEPVGFAVLDRKGRVIAGLGNGGIYRLEFGSAHQELLARPCRDNPDNIANDGKCDRVGRLWAGTKNKSEKPPWTGSLGRFDSGPRLTEIVYPVNVSNGIAWSPDNTKMYYNDSTDKIWRFDYDLHTGTATNRQVFVDLPDTGGIPDGMTIDAENLLYVAKWGGSRIDVYRDDNGKGILVETIAVPTAFQTSSVAFGGDDLKTLFITTAAMNLTPEQQAKYPDSGRIFAVERSNPGLTETRFDDRMAAAL